MLNPNEQSPFSVSMNGDNELIKESLFATMDEPDSANNYIIGIVTKTNAVQALRINGAPVNTTLFTAFATDTVWSWANIPINPGVYKVQSDSGFQGIHYTYYNNPLQPAHYIFPSYGFVLAESVVWPEDSSFFEAGLSIQNLMPFAAFNSPICAGEAIFFQPNHARHTTWLWSFGDGTTFTQRVGSTRAPAVSHTFANPGRYWVTVTDSAGCAQPDSLLIVVEPNPKANFEAQTQLSCEGYYISLQNQSNGATSYNWQWPGGISTAENPNF
jgi:PKD repeat protein